MQDVHGLSPLLLLLCGAQPLSNLSSWVQELGARYDLVLPSATRVRKIGATEVAMRLGDTTDTHLVTRHLSHSAATETQYYQAIVRDTHSANAFELMEGLCKGKKKGILKKGADKQGSESVRESPCTSSKSDGSLLPTTLVQKRRAFTSKETESVSSAFTSHIHRRCTPSLAECKRFLQTHPLHVRSPKNIQEKVKNLMKTAN